MDGDVLGSLLGAFDLDGKTVGSSDGCTFILGNILGVSVSGSLDTDGYMVSDGCRLGCLVGDISITVGRKLSAREGSIEAVGISLIFVVGEILMLGPMLGFKTGCNDLDGCNEG
jgi:hypothetical protein